jgi:cytochrome o ubiquinol oxidase subunit 3
MQQHVLTTAPARVEACESQETGSTTLLGFWIYLMSDCILFAAVFAAYVVLSGATASGPAGKDLFDLPYVLLETFCLLTSSLTCGLAMLAVGRGRSREVLGWLVATFVLGLAFIGMELHEFHGLIAARAGPDRSAFLSGFFTLVGTHGLHVAAGLLWTSVLIAQVLQRGLTRTNETRLMCFSLFWHFLDVIWIGVFTVVYLRGAIA